jgi:hypothetical protein
MVSAAGRTKTHVLSLARYLHGGKFAVGTTRRQLTDCGLPKKNLLTSLPRRLRYGPMLQLVNSMALETWVEDGD